MTNTMKMLAIMELVDELTAEGWFVSLSISQTATGLLSCGIWVKESPECGLEEGLISISHFMNIEETIIKIRRSIHGVV